MPSVDERLRALVGELTIQNLAAGAKLEELNTVLAEKTQKIAELEAELAARPSQP